MISPHFSFSLRIDTNNVWAGVEVAKLLKQDLESGANIPQNQECLWFTEGPNLLKQMDSLGDYIQIWLGITHACPLDSVFVQIDHAGGLWQARPPLAHGNSFALVAI